MAHDAQQQQQRQQRHLSDHCGGDLSDLIEQLRVELSSVSAELGLKPVLEVVHLLKENPKCAELLNGRFLQLMKAAEAAIQLDDTVAEQLKTKGNDAFVKGDLDSAAMFYTRAMSCVASDELLAALLNNRATCSFQSKKFRDSLLDSHMALILKPSYWKALQRRGLCLAALGWGSLGEKDAAAFALQDVTASCNEEELREALTRPFLGPFFPPPRHSLHPSVALQRDGKGRFVVATSKLEAGTQILLETPYAIAPRGEGQLVACSLCMHRTSTLYPCHRSRLANRKTRGLFCSTTCGEKFWELYGEQETHPFYLLCPVDALLALRSIQSQFVSSEAEGESRSQPFDPLTDNKFGREHMDCLVGFSKEVVPFAEVGGSESIVAAIALVSGVVSQSLAEKLRKAMRQILANAQPIECVDRITASADDTSHQYVRVTVGKALYPITSLFNHSCEPNCIISFRGNPHACSSQVSIRLLRSAQEGEELTIAYGGIDKTKVHSTRARIRALRGKYGFGCTCHACRNSVDEPVRREDESHYLKASDYYQKGKRLLREGKIQDAITVLHQSYEIVMRHICPPPRPPQMMLPKTHDALAQAYLLAGDREKCSEHLKASLELLQQLHGDYDYPDLVREYARLATIDRNANFAHKAIALMERCFTPSEFLEAEKMLILQSIQ